MAKPLSNIRCITAYAVERVWLVTALILLNFDPNLFRTNRITIGRMLPAFQAGETGLQDTWSYT